MHVSSVGNESLGENYGSGGGAGDISGQEYDIPGLRRQINKNFKLIFLSTFLLNHIGNVNRIHMFFKF